MDSWRVLAQVLVVLCGATLLGLAVQRLKQNAVVGYLLAGVLLGPRVLRVAESDGTVRMLAELGVALLLFTVGLEFSLKRLRALGATVAWLGALQIVATAGAVYLAASALGLAPLAAFTAGMAVAFSSTTVVLRIVSERGELDSSHGRTALGILLLQDVAVIPAMLLVPALAEAGKGWEGMTALAYALLKGLGLLVAIYGVVRWLVPGMMLWAASRQNRDIPVLLSVSVCIGCSWASHAVGLSPILGAFAAGIILAESPLADQIRADVIPLRAAFLPLFFSSIGMLAAVPGGTGIVFLIVLVAALIVVKTVLVVLLGLALRQPPATAIRTGIVLAQIGEFSFVLLESGFREGLVDAQVFQILLSASVGTLLLTPLLIHHSGTMAAALAGIISRFAAVSGAGAAPSPDAMRDHVIVVGFGPAGQQVAQELRSHGVACLVVDLNPRTAASTSEELPIEYGDATQPEILEHARVQTARAVVVTVPDPFAARLTISQVRKLAKPIPIIARVRYNIYQQSLLAAGADRLVNEEVLVGRQLARETLTALAPRPVAEE